MDGWGKCIVCEFHSLLKRVVGSWLPTRNANALKPP